MTEASTDSSRRRFTDELPHRVSASPTAARPRYAWSIPGFLEEKPGMGLPEAWCYTDRYSYRPGDVVQIHTHTTAGTYSLRLVRDSVTPETVWSQTGLPGAAHPTPDDAYEVGCGWPVATQFTIDPAWRSGLYLLIITIEEDGRLIEREHFVVVAPPVGRPRSPYALVLTTSTLIAYNDWGGANHYRGVPSDDPWEDIPSARLSIERPIARGMLKKPDEAPRSTNPQTPVMGELPRHPAYEWAHAHGYSRHHSDAFWATYERPFAHWAERHGFDLDFLTQHDLHDDQSALDGYSCAIFVGHDEYWTAQMRDTVDAFVDAGGHVARFAGNFLWQVRFEEDGRVQVCYKDPPSDPLYESDPVHVTTAWDWPPIGRPGAETMGLTGLAGVYNRYGSAVARGSGGFTVYRPSHWALEGTALGYGDVFGSAPVAIAAFEVDGCDYTFRHGLPYPTHADGTPDTVTIIAMCPATFGEFDLWQGRVPLGAPVAEAQFLLDRMYPEGRPAHLAGDGYGAGMVVEYQRGRGSVFCAGSCEWVNGLRLGDEFTEAITLNVLRAFGSR